MSDNNSFFSDLPARVSVEGKTKFDRQMSVASTASTEAIGALVTLSGKAGKAIREQHARKQIEKIAEQASRGNYRPTAEYFSVKLGQPFVISGRAAFDSLPDRFEEQVMKSSTGTYCGYTITKKGEVRAKPALALALELKATAEFLIELRDKFREDRLAANIAKAEAERPKYSEEYKKEYYAKHGIVLS